MDALKPQKAWYHLDENHIFDPVAYGPVALYQIGRLYGGKDTVILPHMHLGWFELTIVTSGCGQITTNETTYEGKAGDIILSLPAEKHAITVDKKNPLRYDFFSFAATDDTYRNALKELAKNVRHEKRIFQDERISQLIDLSLAEFFDAENKMDKALITALLSAIVSYVIRDFANQKRNHSVLSKDDELVYRLTHYIDTHLTSMRSLQELSNAFDYNYAYLSAFYHRKTGQTLKEYWDSRRFLAACTFLENDKPCGEIAELLHYSSSFAFSKAFRRVTGKSPREYRKSKPTDQLLV